MLIDIICLLILVMAVFKGISQGLIVALFSFVSFIVGLAAAMKLSSVVANYLSVKMNVQGYWLPILSFIIVFAAVVLIVRWAAAIIKKAVRIAFLGWLDTLGGIVLYALMYFMVFSVVLFFASQMRLITPEMQAASKAYPFIQPWGPKVLNALGIIIPFFKGMFHDLQVFFQGVSDKAK